MRSSTRKPARPTPSSPFEQNVQFEDASATEEKKLKKVIKYALRGIADARNELNKALEEPRIRVKIHFKIDGTSDQDKAHIKQIINNYNIIVGAFLGHRKTRYDMERTGPYFVGSVSAYVSDMGSLKATPLNEVGEIKIVSGQFFKQSFIDQQRILVHEAAHRFAGLIARKYLGLFSEHYYENGATPKDITSEQAINNADSYAYFAIKQPAREDMSIRVKSPY